MELLHDGQRRVPGQEESTPGIGLEIGETLLMRALEIWQEMRTVLPQGRDRLDLVAFDKRYGVSRCDRTLVVDPASERILHGRASRGAIRYVGDSDPYH